MHATYWLITVRVHQRAVRLVGVINRSTSVAVEKGGEDW